MWFPESPRWLIDNNREAEALEILADVHGGGDANNELVQLEFAEIKAQVDFERKEGAKSYRDLLHPDISRRVFLGMSLQAWSQLSGMNIMMYYITYVFQGAGLSGRRGNLIASAVQYVLNVAFTVPAIIYIDRWGRRPMMIIGFSLMAMWLFLVGGLQGGFGHWDRTDPSTRESFELWKTIHVLISCVSRLDYLGPPRNYQSHYCLFVPVCVQFCCNNWSYFVDISSRNIPHEVR